MIRLARSFFDRDALTVGVDLLNKVLVVDDCAVRVVETEAYTQDDPASHTFRGSTPRNRVMFGAPGHLYVYFTYGMHHCLNVVTSSEGVGEAVLLRAALPLAGVPTMEQRRQRRDHLLDGPAKLCQALGLDLSANGVDLCHAETTVFIADDGVRPPSDPLVTARVGISRAVDWPRRFLVRPT